MGFHAGPKERGSFSTFFRNFVACVCALGFGLLGVTRRWGEEKKERNGRVASSSSSGSHTRKEEEEEEKEVEWGAISSEW